MDINDKIAENTGLVYRQLHSFQLLYDQDAESYAYEALYNAVITYDGKTGTAFSTYAVCCINNALRKHLRTLNKKRQLDIVSYDAPITADEDSPAMIEVIPQLYTVEDALLCAESCEFIKGALVDEYKKLSEKHRVIVRLFLTRKEDMSQQAIAKAAGVTQATVSKIISAFRHKIKQRLEEY